MSKKQNKETASAAAILTRSKTTEVQDQSADGLEQTGSLSQSETGADADLPDQNSELEHLNVEAFNLLAKKILPTYSCAALEKSITPYNGTSSGCPDVWLKGYERYTKLKRWDDETAAISFPLFLESSARSWHESLPTSITDDYTNVRELFLKEFTLSGAQMLAELDTLSARKQATDERLEDYLLDISKTCRRLGRTTQQHLEHAIQGLRPDIKRQVLLQQPKSLEDVRRIGTLCESVSAMENNQSNGSNEPTVAAVKSDIDARFEAQEREIQRLRTQLAVANNKNNRGRQFRRGGPYQRPNQPNRSTGNQHCTRCGKWHSLNNRGDCPAWGKTCDYCHFKNHFKVVCRKKQRDEASGTTNQEASSEHQ